MAAHDRVYDLWSLVLVVAVVLAVGLAMVIVYMV
jgi:hypothetical protein